jgi:hypothetical protein
MNAYSEDLRIGVLSYVESGHKYKETGERFGVSTRAICAWVRLKRETGTLKIKAVPRSPHVLPPYNWSSLCEVICYNYPRIRLEINYAKSQESRRNSNAIEEGRNIDKSR